MALIKRITNCDKRQKICDKKQKSYFLPRLTVLALAGTLSGCSTSALIQMPVADNSTVASPQHQDALESLLSEARSARADHQLDEAESLLNRAMRINPTSPKVYYQMALLRQAQGQTAQVNQLAERALSLGPDAALAREIRRLIRR